MGKTGEIKEQGPQAAVSARVYSMHKSQFGFLGVYRKPTGFIYNARKLAATLFALAPHVLQVNWERIVVGCLSGC